MIHQDAKVIAQIRARDAERPHAAQHEEVTGREEDIGDGLTGQVLEEGMAGLKAEGAFVASGHRFPVRKQLCMTTA